MEGLFAQRMTPIIKCLVLFLFIFTARALTSRPQEPQEKNSIQQVKPYHYVRTFTKYHHRRTIQWNNMQDYWPVTQDQPKIVGKRSAPNLKIVNDNWPGVKRRIRKRSVNIPNLNDYKTELNQIGLDPNAANIIGGDHNVINSGNLDKSSKNGLTNDVKKYKDKIESPTVMSRKVCVYKADNVARSATPNYNEDKNAQMTVENDLDLDGEITDMVLNGEEVQVEQCTDPRAICYTLWHYKNGNITVLGQGCWKASESKRDRCLRSPSKGINATFCSCSRSYCNADFTSIPEEVVTPKAESTVRTASTQPNYSNAIASAILALAAILVMALVVRKFYCGTKGKQGEGEEEKGDIMGTGPDALATGLSCVDNITLIEHIGQGKFGSVWRGTLGATPVAVKLYSSASAWQKEAAIYALPHLSHPNILNYYGSDSRPALEGGPRSHLIVLELCEGTLQARLERAPLTWLEFATLAHGLSAALAHLHTSTPSKPCIVHRDVNSSNVLVCGGQARLADLGLAQVLHRNKRANAACLTEAGTLRYLAPEALDGALDLDGAGWALCAVDVYALGLVLWEMLWRCAGAHAGPPPPHAVPYHAMRPLRPNMQAGTLRYLAPEALDGALDLDGAGWALCAVDVYALGLVLWEMLWRCAGAHAGPPPPHAVPYHAMRPLRPNMQNLVSRNKARPPLPKGPVPEARALKIACDTCDECWDHDAEARLTAVCVEERMAELKAMLQTQAPVIHDNNLHPHPPGDPSNPSPSEDKNSNCTSTQTCDVTTPLLYPHPHIGRNACIERNTHTNTHNTVQLIHKSLKDITAPVDAPRVQNTEQCLSVARASHRPVPDFENSDRLNEIRSYQRPLDYVPNDVSSHDVDRGSKQTNLLQEVKVEKPKWGIRKFLEQKLNRSKVETEVKLVPEVTMTQNGRTRTSVVNDKPSNIYRPSNLVISQGTFNFEAPCTLSPPNRTLSPTMIIESEMRTENNVFGFKELPTNETDQPNQVFAVIVPKSKPRDCTNLIELKKRGSSESINKHSVRTSMSSQSIFKSGNSESEDSTVKKRLSCDNRIITDSNSASSSRASINLELQYIDNQTPNFTGNTSPFDLNSECSSSEDEHLMLLSENGGSKITMQTVKPEDKKKYQIEVLQENQTKDYTFNKSQNKYTNFDNEFSDPNDKENSVNYSGDNPVYLAALNGEIETDLKYMDEKPKSPKPSLKIAIKRQHSLEQVSEIFSSSGDVHLQNPAGRVKTPGDLPVAVRRARRDRVLQKGRGSECNRLSLYDDRMMFGNSL